MQTSWESPGLAALAGLIIGLLVGFLPTHASNTNLRNRMLSWSSRTTLCKVNSMQNGTGLPSAILL